jgi:small neutral amino acid transporter SnatA (MarC family)
MPTLNVHMLVYLQENMDKVKITKFDFDLMPETEDEEEITVLPVAVPGVAGPSK